MGLALDAVPEGIDAVAVRAHLAALPGVTAIHDLHIWGMSTTETALTCHLVMPGGHPGDAVLARLAQSWKRIRHPPRDDPDRTGRQRGSLRADPRARRVGGE